MFKSDLFKKILIVLIFSFLLWWLFLRPYFVRKYCFKRVQETYYKSEVKLKEQAKQDKQYNAVLMSWYEKDGEESVKRGYRSCLIEHGMRAEDF